MKHPDVMTMAELEALPTVAHIFRPVRSFVAANGTVWDVGGAPTFDGPPWVKAFNTDRPPAASASVRLERPKRA